MCGECINVNLHFMLHNSQIKMMQSMQELSLESRFEFLKGNGTISVRIQVLDDKTYFFVLYALVKHHE
jgi:hypothetical protein